MRKIIGIGLLASLALVGLASCGEDDKPVTLMDSNGESYTVKETDDIAEVNKVIDSLNALATNAKKVKASISVDTNIVEKDAAGNVFFKNKVKGKGVVALDLTNANYTPVNGLSNWTTQDSTAFFNNVKATKAYIDADFTADMVSVANPSSTGKADIDATIYQNKYKITSMDYLTGTFATTKNVIGVYANVKKSDIEGFGETGSKVESVSSMVSASKLYISDEAIFDDYSKQYKANNILTIIQNTPPSFEVAMAYLSKYIVDTSYIDGKSAIKIDDASNGIIYFKNEEYWSTLPKSVGVGLNAHREVTIGVEAKSGRVREIEVEYDNIKSVDKTHNVTKDDFDVEVKLNYDSKVSVKGVAKGQYFDASPLYQLFVSGPMIVGYR